MNILHFSTQDLFGGAAKAAYRLHVALRDQGHDSTMIVCYKQSQDKDVESVTHVPLSRWQSRLGRVINHVPGLRKTLPTTGYHTFNFDIEKPIDLGSTLNRRGPVDIICLHWITGFLTVSNIREIYDHFRCPLVLLLMDQEPLTGGCHYSFDCEGYTRQCGNCPQLSPNHPNDHSHIVWLRKYKLLKGLPITLIAANSWAAERIGRSSLFGDHPVSRIPVPIDSKIFRPMEQTVARDILQIPQDKKILFFGAYGLDDVRKGMSYLYEALHQLAAMTIDKNNELHKENIFLLIAGGASSSVLKSLPFDGKELGLINEDLVLALAYQAADAFVCPSVEDGGPVMVSESLLCGTPVVAFKSGIAPDLVKNMKNGYIAKYKDSIDLAKGIHAVLSASDSATMRASCREVAVKEHEPKLVAQRYETLFASLVSNHMNSTMRTRQGQIDANLI